MVVRTAFILALHVVSILPIRAQEDDANAQNAASLFSGARLTKYPESYSASSDKGLVSNYSAESLIDGSQEKIWCSAAETNAPFVFEIELVETFNLTAFEFNTIVEDHAGIGARDVLVEVAPSKRSPVFTTVLKASLKQRDVSRFKIATAEARMIRVTIASNHGNTGYTELAEFKALGTPKTPDIELINIDGDWNSNWDDMTFKQSGTLVEGHYVFNSGVIRYGGIQRNKITYTWVEDVIRRRGNTIMFMNEEGNELVGIWCYDNDWSNYGFWILSRTAGIPFVPVYEEQIHVAPVPVEVKQIEADANIVSEMATELKTQKKMVVYGINFKYNSADILPESHTVLRQIYEVLKTSASMNVRIEGHTDSRGTDEYNNTLSLQRAESVRQFFIQMDIDKNRISAEGRGEAVPVADNESEMGRGLNRRVEIHLKD